MLPAALRFRAVFALKINRSFWWIFGAYLQHQQKTSPLFEKENVYNSFKFQVFGFPCFFLDDLQLRRFSCLSGVETWPFFGGVLKPGQEKEDEDPTSSTGSLGKGRSNNTKFMVFLWNINMEPKHEGSVQMTFLFNSGILGCYVNLQGCNFEGAFFGNTITTWRKGEMLVKCLLHSKPIKKVQDVGAIKQ